MGIYPNWGRHFESDPWLRAEMLSTGHRTVVSALGGGWVGGGTLCRPGYTTAWASFRPHRPGSRMRRCVWGNYSRAVGNCWRTPGQTDSSGVQVQHKNKKQSRAWWRTPLIPALRRQRQADFCLIFLVFIPSHLLLTVSGYPSQSHCTMFMITNVLPNVPATSKNHLIFIIQLQFAI